MVRCECKIRTYHPFVMGGRPISNFEQCKNDATIRVFPNPEIDDMNQSPMVLCERCYAEFVILNPDYKIEEIV